MIYIFTALYHEAHSLISHYSLKKDTANTRFQVFYSEDEGIRLTVTGAGEIAAAAAVASICTQHQPGRGDFLINAGVCAVGAAENAGNEGYAGAAENAGNGGYAGAAENAGNVGRIRENGNLRGQMFLCNKLIEQETGKTFYPDILYRHDFAENCIITGRKMLLRAEAAGGMLQGEEQAGGGRIACPERILYDMEAAAVYQAGAYFFAPHQMSFLKIVSDSGDAEGVSRERVGHLMEENREKIVSYIETLHRAGEREREVGKSRTFGLGTKTAEEEADMLDRLCADLHCSAVMRASVQQYLRYLALSGISYDRMIKQMYEDGRLPCRDKREGKVRFEELKRELL